MASIAYIESGMSVRQHGCRQLEPTLPESVPFEIIDGQKILKRYIAAALQEAALARRERRDSVFCHKWRYLGGVTVVKSAPYKLLMGHKIKTEWYDACRHALRWGARNGRAWEIPAEALWSSAPWWKRLWNKMKFTAG